MRVPEPLSTAFGPEFETLIKQFICDHGLLDDPNEMDSPRFLARSVVPHIKKLSSLFNRFKKDQAESLDPYWKESSNPVHLRLAYFLYFMPSNLFRVAAVWAELQRLGFKWPEGEGFRAIEFGAGPASGACGIAAGEVFAPCNLPTTGSWALIEQDKAILKMGEDWSRTYFNHLGKEGWDVRPYHRKIDPADGFLPRAAPQFNLWLMSYYLNETSIPAKELARTLIREWDLHLKDEGIVILVEPALKLQSRRLLELRKEILDELERKKDHSLKILLPCLGHQVCGAFANAEDWCHEEVTWWRPPYFKKLDAMAGLDRKTLPFSYLVLAKSRRSREEILPALGQFKASERERLVSPAHYEGHEQEFFLCGQDGKQRSRYRGKNESDPAGDLQRGNILLKPEIRGNKNSSRIDRIKKVL